MSSILRDALGPGIDEFLESLVFVGARTVTEEGKTFQVDGAETEICDCVVQPYVDSSVSMNPEGKRERQEKIAYCPPLAYGQIIREDDYVRDGKGIKYQIIWLRNWTSYVEARLRAW
jgi:hypothetical protein